MQTLSEPLFEVNPECDYYKLVKRKKDNEPKVDQIFKDVANEFGYDYNDFAYYGCSGFGFYGGTKSYEKFKSDLTKKADRNGIHTFKLTSKIFKLISPKFSEVDDLLKSGSPFTIHDIFGWNNLKASQWIGDRLFFEVKNVDQTEKLLNAENRRERFEIEPVMKINYKNYLELVMEKLDWSNVYFNLGCEKNDFWRKRTWQDFSWDNPGI